MNVNISDKCFHIIKSLLKSSKIIQIIIKIIKSIFQLICGKTFPRSSEHFQTTLSDIPPHKESVMKPVKVNTLAACIAAIGFSPIIYAADNTPTVILDTVTVKGTRNKDEIGKNRVYAREIVNLYKGKNEVETFKGNTVSDLLSGMSGVYSGDARNSGALDPNIRGVQ